MTFTNKQEIALLEEIDRLNERIVDLEDEITHLEKENQELLVNKNLAQGVALKYKKAIDFFKENFEVCEDNGIYKLYFSNCMIRVFVCEIDKQEYELLKEVLENGE